jgi:hypothetical protein
MSHLLEVRYFIIADIILAATKTYRLYGNMLNLLVLHGSGWNSVLGFTSSVEIRCSQKAMLS